MKRIILSENQIALLKEDIHDLRANKLPPYVYNSVKKHNTSLGESPAFPPSNDYDYDYKILKVRFNEIINTLDELQLPKNEEEAENLLYKLMKQAVDMEKPFREQLDKLVYNTVYKLFAVPPETINLICELVDEVTPRNALRIVPEDNSDGDVYTFNDVEEMNQVADIVKQRRFINSLIQGYALIVSTDYQLYNDFFEDKGLGDLIDLYEKINALNDYLSFSKKEKINKKKQSLISYVEVHLGHRDEKTNIKSQGLIFPYLLRETVRGFMELFASHGLPKDNTKAQSIVSLSDFTMAEPWDIRFGKVLWEKMFPHNMDSTKIPYLFADYASMPSDEFFKMSQNMLAHTKRGKEYIENELNDIEHDVEYNKFLQGIQQKNIETSMITDGYMTADDLDNYTIEEDDGDLEENREDEYGGSGEVGMLKSYFTMDDDVKDDDSLYRNACNIYDFIMQGNYQDDFTNEELQELKDNDDNCEYEANIDILKNHEEVLKDFLKTAKYNDEEWNQNANDVMDYEKDIDINKEWLIHFTNYPDSIAYKGFTAGTQDIETLALTRRDSNTMEGYDFAFLADYVSNQEARYYCGTDTDNWGAVMFHANGVQTYHYGDEQTQIVFWGPSAFDIIPIYHGDISDSVGYDNEDVYSEHRGSIYDTWYIKDDVTDRILFSDEDIENIVSWVETNFHQYRNRLNRSKNVNNDMYYPNVKQRKDYKNVSGIKKFENRKRR